KVRLRSGLYRTFCDVASMFGPKMFGPKTTKGAASSLAARATPFSRSSDLYCWVSHDLLVRIRVNVVRRWIVVAPPRVIPIGRPTPERPTPKTKPKPKTPTAAPTTSPAETTKTPKTAKTAPAAPAMPASRTAEATESRTRVQG